MRSQFDWYKMRLAAMSVPELAYRLAHGSVNKQDDGTAEVGKRSNGGAT